jgi:hypothetical protein
MHQHGHETHETALSTNRLALSATLHCLTGCGIGEVLGLVIASLLGWHVAPSIALAVILAFFFGYSLTLRPLLASGVSLGQAVRLALAADTASIAVMEVVDNAVLLAVPGAMQAGLTDALFWGSLALGLGVAFIVTFPVNRWLISRGGGHGLVHAAHSTRARAPNHSG